MDVVGSMLSYPLGFEDLSSLIRKTANIEQSLQSRMTNAADAEESSYFSDKMVLSDVLWHATDDASLLTPTQLLSIRNVIVEVLCHQHTIYTIMDNLHAVGTMSPSNKTHFMKSFRLWLSILLTLMNAPTRKQGTSYLQVPRYHTNATIPKARLIYMDSHLHLRRIFLLDKVGKERTMPVSVPMDTFLSFFLSAYITHLTPRDAVYVFGGGGLRRWSARAEYFVAYLTDPEGIVGLPTWIIPDHKIIRRIGINALGVKYQFDRNKMRDVATISRHTVDVLFKEYTYWSSLYRARHIDDINKQLSLYYHVPSPAHIHHSKFSPINKTVDEHMRDRYKNNELELNIPYRTPLPSPSDLNVGGGGTRRNPKLFIGERPYCTVCNHRAEFIEKTEQHFVLRCTPGCNTGRCWYACERKSFRIDHTLLPCNENPHGRPKQIVRKSTIKKVPIVDKYNLVAMYGSIVTTIPRDTVFIGLDLSPNANAICVMTDLTHYKIHCHTKVVTTQLYLESPFLVHTAIDSTVDMATIISRHIGEHKRNGKKVYIGYEGSLPKKVTTDDSQRGYIATIIDRLQELYPSETFYNLDNLAIKRVWRKVFMDSEEIPDNNTADVYDIMSTFIDSHQRIVKSKNNVTFRQYVKKTYKLRNFILWRHRNLEPAFDIDVPTNVVMPTYNPTSSVQGTSLDWFYTAAKQASGHPVSDIIDSYIIARHVLLSTIFSGRVHS
jgi:hypothetical protein